ncbi:phosphoadenosine phosphosulfate reductase family protein [Agrobacterium rosae]|nr:phosphoadenosine phosphosulfate reductase family protein [Agrobacterium rosae]
MMYVSRAPEIDALIAHDCPVAIGVSGGKDSQAAALATFQYLNAIGHAGPRILIHADLGLVEWNDSLPVCEELADHLRCDLIVVRRKAGGLMERWESRWVSSKARYELLSTVTLVPCWSTPDMRFCTSELKTHVIIADLKKRYPDQEIINVTGIRRAESRNRSRMAICDGDAKSRVWNWRPILDWSEEEVFAAIDASGLRPHPAYREFGMGRVSCRYCIMSNVSDLAAASAQPESHDLYRRMVALEADSGFGFQGARWLGDVAPQLLDGDLSKRLASAKRLAVIRRELEAHITPEMKYVKGWPLRMLTNDEAERLSFIRRNVAGLYGFESSVLYPDEIHARYADLLDEKSRKVAA